MEHVLAILGLGLVCALWFWVQRASGREDSATSGTCGFCGGGVCRRPGEERCERGADRVEGGPGRSEPVRGRRGWSAVPVTLALVALIGVGVWIGVAAQRGPAASQRQALTHSEMLMGTAWTIAVEPEEGVSDVFVERAVRAAFAEVARIEGIMSEWRDDSALSAVNRSAGGPPVAVPAELRDLIARSLTFSERSGGAFDVTWRGMGDVWNVYTEGFEVPSDAAIAEAMAHVDYRRVVVTDDGVGLGAPGMAIGLGGIAKGYAIDRAAAVLEREGLRNFDIDGGGDVLVHGERRGRPWRVGVRNPRGEHDALIATLALREGAVVTSGDYERFRVIDGVRYHHIIDPRTGWPAQGSISVTVVGPSAEAADALATAVFVLGPEAGLALIESEPRTEALVVDPEGGVHMSSGFRALTR